MNEDGGEQGGEGAAPTSSPAAAPTLRRFVLHGTAGELKGTLVPPKSRGIREELRDAARDNKERAWGAALGLCSGAVRKHVRADPNHLRFGLAVNDWLLEQGVPWEEVREVGADAWLACVESLPDHQRIGELEAFSAPGPAASTT